MIADWFGIMFVVFIAKWYISYSLSLTIYVDGMQIVISRKFTMWHCLVNITIFNKYLAIYDWKFLSDLVTHFKDFILNVCELTWRVSWNKLLELYCLIDIWIFTSFENYFYRKFLARYSHLLRYVLASTSHMPSQNHLLENQPLVHCNY